MTLNTCWQRRGMRTGSVCNLAAAKQISSAGRGLWSFHTVQGLACFGYLDCSACSRALPISFFYWVFGLKRCKEY